MRKLPTFSFYIFLTIPKSGEWRPCKIQRCVRGEVWGVLEWETECGQLRPGVTSYKSVCTPDASCPPVSTQLRAGHFTCKLQYLHTAHYSAHYTAVNCPADRWETNHLPHVETHEEMAKKLFNMSCRVTRETLPANSNIIDRRRFESLHLLIIFFSRNTWQFVLLGDLNEQNMFLKYHGKSYLLLCCDLLLPILQHRHVDIIC